MQAKPKAKAYLVWDALQRGLALRVWPSGSRAWYCVYSRKGRARWMHLGNADTIKLGDARLLAGEAMLAVARGKDPAAERQARRSSGTFLQELHAKYLDEYARKMKSLGDRLMRSSAVTCFRGGGSCKRWRSPVLTSRR